MKNKKQYIAPKLERFGFVSELTATGLTMPGDDAKSGSVGSKGV